MRTQLEKAEKIEQAKKSNREEVTNNNNQTKKFHKVRAGESLYAIAKKYDVSVKDLADWNNLKAKKSIQTGTKLVVLVEENDSKNDTRSSKKVKTKRNQVANQQSDSPKKNKKERIKRISYEVKRGDTLYSISQRYNVSVSQIKTWNKTSNNLKPGQDLVIYLAKS